MPRFLDSKTLVLDAQKRGYAVPAMNTNGGSYDITRAALEAAQELQAPMIIQVYEPNAAYRGYGYFVQLTSYLYDDLGISVPVALHLDHGKSFDSIVRAIQAGLTGVMFDASHEPLEVNIARTRRVVELARAAGVSVEAEIGYVKGNEPPQGSQIGRVPIPETPSIPPAKSRPDEVERFATEVDLDMLAVSIGSTHGVYQRQENLDYELLETIRRSIEIPLVMHGTGGISESDLTRLAGAGMSKINFGEPFLYNFIRYFNDLTDTAEHLWHSWRIMQNVKDKLKQDMASLIVALGADGKA